MKAQSSAKSNKSGGSMNDVKVYTGEASATFVGNEAVVNANRQVVQEISQPIAQANCQFFKDKQNEKLEEALRSYIYVVDTSKGEQPMVDNYGRVTYYYACLGDQAFPVYQPGTIMFECGVVNNADLAVTHGGSQQNGAILGNGCAIFLCKFTASLVKCYNEMMFAA